MKKFEPKEIPIAVRKSGGMASPHVLDLRAHVEEGREVERGEENKERKKIERERKGEENWMKQQYHSPRVLKHRPRSFHLWRRHGIARPQKHALKLNFYRAAVRPPEAQVADMAQGGEGMLLRLAKVGNRCIHVLFYCGVYFWRAIKWVWAGKQFLRKSASGRIRAAQEDITKDRAAGHSPRFAGEAGLRVSALDHEEDAVPEEELDDTPVAIWRRAEVFTLVGLTFGLLVAVKAAGSFDDWKLTRGVVLGEAIEGVQALVAAHDAFAHADMPAAIDRFLVAQERFAHVTQTIEDNALASALGAIPPFKSGLGLMQLGERSSQAAEHLLLGLKSLDEARIALNQPSSLVSAALGEGVPALFALPLSPLQNAVGELRKGEDAFREAQVAAATIREEDIPEDYRPAVASLKAVLPPAGRLLRQSRTGAELLVSFFGAEQPRRFLVLFQNDAELRPTGGFMGSYALVDADKGRITSLIVPGGGFYDLKGSLTTRVDAPYPFHLFSPSWQAWNANWFFDFPSSARTIAWFIEKSQGPTVDGMIAITPSVLEQILALTGPVVLPQYHAVIDEQNVRRVLQDETEQNYDRAENKPKQIIADLVPVIIQRVPIALTEKPVETFAFAARALDRHDILLWSFFPEEQTRIAEAGWGGTVAAPQGDYLAVVHTNIGGGKTDRVFEESWQRTLALTSEGDGVAKLEITRAHRGNIDDRYGKTHHVDFMRVFVPEGSTLISAEGFDAPDAQLFKYDTTLGTHPELAETELLDETASGVRVGREHGLTTFGGWIMTKAGETSTVTITYRLSKVVKVEGAFVLPLFGSGRPRTYSLTVQRQPGAPEANFTDTVLAPEEWGPARSEQGIVGSSQELIIDRDKGYTLTWD